VFYVEHKLHLSPEDGSCMFYVEHFHDLHNIQRLAQQFVIAFEM